ncbi:MAG: alpha/beta hydrolase [Myxococcales bacterium]|nr:alpha/beta hydrolase [Myxococcales bacterium]
MGRVRAVITGVATFLLITYLGYGAVLYLLQDRMVFPAPGGFDRAGLDQAAREVGAVPLELTASDGTGLYAWHRPTRGADRLVIYLPGNAETVAANIGLQRLLDKAGWAVLSLAYRGYPGSDGSPTEEGTILDADAAWTWAVGEGGYHPGRIVIHGRSIGGGVAAHLTERRNPAGLVLESTFASLRALAKRRAPLYPVDWLLRHPFDTDLRAPRLGVPVLVMHSSDDQLIPLALGGKQLLPVLAEAEYHETSGFGHQHCLPVDDRSLRQAYLSFLERLVPRR